MLEKTEMKLTWHHKGSSGWHVSCSSYGTLTSGEGGGKNCGKPNSLARTSSTDVSALTGPDMALLSTASGGL